MHTCQEISTYTNFLVDTLGSYEIQQKVQKYIITIISNYHSYLNVTGWGRLNFHLFVSFDEEYNEIENDAL